MSESSIRRGLLPEVLWAPDLPLVLGVQTPAAALRILKREGIPYGRVGRRIFVLRTALLAGLARRSEVAPTAAGEGE